MFEPVQSCVALSSIIFNRERSECPALLIAAVHCTAAAFGSQLQWPHSPHSVKLAQGLRLEKDKQ